MHKGEAVEGGIFDVFQSETTQDKLEAERKRLGDLEELFGSCCSCACEKACVVMLLLKLWAFGRFRAGWQLKLGTIMVPS